MSPQRPVPPNNDGNQPQRPPVGPSRPLPPAAPQSGPFASGPVDALVFKQSEDSPELRAAAAAIPTGSQPQIRDSKPRPPDESDVAEWTPGGYVDPATTNRNNKPHRSFSVLRALLLTVLVAVPIVTGWFLVAYGLNLYQQP